MANTSADEAAKDLLAACIAGRPWPEEALDVLVQPAGNRALFHVVVEGLADRFEPRLCDVYADLFSRILGQGPDIVERYRRVRKTRKLDRDPAGVERVYVLSRVTLGADVAITSIILDAAKRLFENATIYFVGPEKSWELFAEDPVLEHAPINYGRTGTLVDRLSVWPQIRELVSGANSIVIDPDSRLTQLGLLPVCAEENYFFFESRSYGGDTGVTLTDLTRRWVAETFGIDKTKPFVAPLPAAGDPADVTISFGVGDNLEKRVDDPFEEELLRYLATHESSILVDRGAGGEEADRVEHAVRKSGARIAMWDGSFAGFASQITRSRLYIGYDSAGGHVAAASGVPLISLFKGEVSERMYQRWRPSGAGSIQVIRASDATSTLAEVIKSRSA